MLWVPTFFERKIVNIFLPVSFKICFGSSTVSMNETVLLSTQNIIMLKMMDKKIFTVSLVPNSVTTKFGFSPTGRHETIRIIEGNSELFVILSAINVK